MHRLAHLPSTRVGMATASARVGMDPNSHVGDWIIIGIVLFLAVGIYVMLTSPPKTYRPTFSAFSLF